MDKELHMQTTISVPNIDHTALLPSSLPTPQAPLENHVSVLQIYQPKCESKIKSWRIFDFIPKGVREFTLNKAWRIRLWAKTLLCHKMSHIQRSNTSPFFATRTIPPDFEKTHFGQNILKIIQILHDKSIFKAPVPKIVEELKHNIKEESCDTGEVLCRLVRLYDPSLQLPEECLALFTLIEKIRRRAHLALDDIRFSQSSRQQMQKAFLEQSLKVITDCTSKLFMDPYSSPCMNQFLIDRTTKEQQALLAKKEEIQKKENDSCIHMIACDRAILSLVEIEREAFATQSNGTYVEQVRHSRLSTPEEIKEFLAQLGSAADHLLFRCIFIDKGEISKNALAGSLGVENILYIPREGDIFYQSKRDCLEDLEKKITAFQIKKQTVEITLWKKHLGPLTSPIPSFSEHIQDPPISENRT